jgi:hypothetical protein
MHQKLENNYVLFAGCSMTAGTGLTVTDPAGPNDAVADKQDPRLWVNLLHQNLFHEYGLINCAQAGRSNSNIFKDAVYNLAKYPCKYAFVAWTCMPRYEVSLALELYHTWRLFKPNVSIAELNSKEFNYSKKYLTDINDRFTMLANAHYEILLLVEYVNSLVNLCKKIGTKIFFINALCPWDDKYFDTIHNVLPNDYTPFTQELIRTNHRDDKEIFALYNKIHQEYKDVGGIQLSHWLNLYESFRNLQIDFNSDNLHPGTKSNILYYEKFSQKLKEISLLVHQ